MYLSICLQSFAKITSQSAPASVMKVNNRFRYKISVVCGNNKTIRDIIAHVVREFSLMKENRGVSAFADSDPLD